jgi:hypothetical protein
MDRIGHSIVGGNYQASGPVLAMQTLFGGGKRTEGIKDAFDVCPLESVDAHEGCV